MINIVRPLQGCRLRPDAAANNRLSLSLLNGFGAYSSICGLRHEAEDSDNDDEFEVEAVYDALAKVIAPDDAIIITEIGYEKLRYLTAYAVVITRTEVEFVELRSAALETAQRMLRSPEYDPCMDY